MPRRRDCVTRRRDRGVTLFGAGTECLLSESGTSVSPPCKTASPSGRSMSLSSATPMVSTQHSVPTHAVKVGNVHSLAEEVKVVEQGQHFMPFVRGAQGE